jgi:hypothetical protein
MSKPTFQELSANSIFLKAVFFLQLNFFYFQLTKKSTFYGPSAVSIFVLGPSNHLVKQRPQETIHKNGAPTCVNRRHRAILQLFSGDNDPHLDSVAWECP